MKPEKNIDEILDRYITSATTEDVESHCDQVFQQLQSRAQDAAPHAKPARHMNWLRIGMVAAAAAILFAVLLGVSSRAGAPAVLESENSRRIEYGETVRANDATGSTLVLADKSRIEMRSGSELSLERADDGVRIRLNKGDVIVSAAKQHGHLYVQTNDVMVSVVGTVFLVKAEAEGSRVAVIEGEVRVQQQGANETKLRPGEQVMSKPIMEWQPVSEEISWSHSAPTHLALLQQSTTSIGVAPQPREAFDVVSIRQSAVVAGGGGRGPGGGVRRRNPRPAGEPCGSPSEPVVDPRRFDASETTVHALIAWAYGLDCMNWRGSDLLFGGPGWLKDDGFEVQAVMPDGSPSYNADQLRSHDAPKLQMMLKAMLADRFKLVMHHEMKEMPVYELTLAKGGPKLTVRPEAKKVDPPLPPGTPRYGEIPTVGLSIWKEGDDACCPGWGPTDLGAKKQTMADLARILSGQIGRPVLDRTGLTGEYNYYLRFAFVEIPGTPGKAPLPDAPLRPWERPPDPRTIFTALEEEFGLRLESTKEKVEVWVIDRVERPSEN